MDARTLFHSVRDAERALWMIRQQREHIREMSTKICGSGGDARIRNPNKRSYVEQAACRLADLDMELYQETEKYATLVHEAREIIKKIPKPKLREVLTLRYLCGHSWRTISDEMEYADEKSVYRAHGYALLEADRIITKIVIERAQNTT